MARRLGAVLGMVFLAQAAAAQFTQQGGKLVGAGAVDPANQGGAVAVSADGSTAIVGGYSDDSNVGAAWVFTRVGGVWAQQGDKLVGTAADGAAWQGISAALSADGNTAIVCGFQDGSRVGAAWVYTRSGGVWSQLGDKLVPTGTVGEARMGWSVAMSADGTTAIVGAYTDNSSAGAAFVFTRSGGVWSQQGSKLVGTGAVGNSPAQQGTSVGISADGNTAIVGGPFDNGSVGAAWVFTRSGGIWAQQGSKLVGTGVVGPYACLQGEAVAISADGNTAIVGGYQDNSAAGATWVFTRSGGVWTQQGSKLVGTGAVGPAQQGWSVALSADGNTALVGGFGDIANVGAAWVFARSGGAWSQQGHKLSGTGAVGLAYQGSRVALSADGRTAVVGGHHDNSNAGAAWVFATPLSFSAWVPVASHNSGKNSSQWRSDLGILNPNSTAATVQLMFFGGGGVVSKTASVPARAQSILVDVVGQIGGSNSGAIEVLADQPLRITARSYNQVSPAASCYASGTQGQDYPALALSDGLSAQQSASLPGLTENVSSYHCNVGVVNIGLAPATVLVELFNGAGTKLTDYTVALDPGQWKQETQPFFAKAGQTAMDRGYAKVTVQSGSGVFAFASVVDGVTNDPTTVTMQGSAPAATLWVPVASHNSGKNSSQWRSDLGLLNPNSATANVQLKFFGGGGVVTNTTFVPAKTQSILADVVGQIGGSNSGAIEVLSDRPLAVTARSYNQVSPSVSCYANGTQGQDYPALNAAGGLGAGQSAYLPGLTENAASYHCNVGLVNIGSGAATALVELFDGAGTKLTDYTVALNPGEWKQETQPFLAKAGQTAMDRGYAKVTVQSGSGVFAFASVVDGVTNDPTTVTMQP